ncbi:DUF4129 domain-containing transglutaminase family protein [Paenibacillus sp. sgz500958]|uniref:DUF4129 domain-containing transglutaminase family protein n=1 Tax=Paenibacillus sp. sgz500958 TaxID=3242475 RepID=UPI0036D24233
MSQLWHPRSGKEKAEDSLQEEESVLPVKKSQHRSSDYLVAENREENSRAGSWGTSPLFYRLLFSLAIMGLFIEWLLPLYQVNMVDETRRLLAVLAGTSGLLLLCGLIQRPFWLGASAQTVVAVLVWFVACSQANGNWFRDYIAEIPGDFILLFSGRVSEVNTETRLLILCAGWSLLVVSVQHLALYRSSTSLFSVVTVVYLLLLNRFLELDTSVQLAISADLILVLQGMCRLQLLQGKNPSGRMTSLPYTRWWIAAVLSATIISGMSWAGKEWIGHQQEKEISLKPSARFLQAWGEEAELNTFAGESSGLTGYSLSEGELGAPLTGSTEPVFKVESRLSAYMKGQSLDHYDGRRWGKSAEGLLPLNLAALPEKRAASALSTEDRILTQRVQFMSPSISGLPLFSAGRVLDVPTVQLADGSRLGFVFASQDREEIRLPETTSAWGITEYTVVSQLPETDPQVLRRLTGLDPEEVQRIYLELPAALPTRVRELADRLTSSADSRYDAAVSVMNYLKTHYTYTLDTKVPPAGADFTDDFLFEVTKGYCVHFATAMTVLLRSADIPARYVKGYGPGTLEVGSVPPRYTVTQGDAHAWVEVYFPGAGWVPFDPTPAVAAASAPPQPGSAPPLAAGADGLPARLRQGGRAAAPLPAALLLVPAAAWRWRRSLRLLLAKRSSSPGPEQLRAAAALAWHGLAARYGAPPPGMTGREYADSLPVDNAGLREAVRQFVRQWETLAYSSPSRAAGAPPPAPRSESFGSAPPGSAPQSLSSGSVSPGFAPQSLSPGSVSPGSVPQSLSSESAPPGSVPHSMSSGSVSPPGCDSQSASNFIRVCLDITLRVT